MARLVLRSTRATRRSTLGLVAALSASALFLTACGSDSGDAGADASNVPSGSTPAELTEVTFAMEYLPSVVHNGLAYAIHEGLFADEGIKLKLIPFSGAGSDTIIGSGKAEVGFIGNVGAGVTDLALGVPLTPVFMGQPSEPQVMAALKDSGITSPKDFVGKTYGGYGFPQEDLILKTMVETDGGDGEVKSVALQVGSTEALKAGQVDLAALWPDHVFEFVNSGVELNTWFGPDYGVPDGGGLVAVANNDFLSANPDLVKGFVKALQGGYQMAIDDPSAANEALYAEFPDLKSNTDLVEFVADSFAESSYPNPDGPVGTLSADQWSEYADYLAENGLLVDKDGKTIDSFDPTPFVTNDYMP
ncbi:exported hypothetical protein [metagenome]|uniref:Thiamine pyrimidine synthase n=1 Tax=metagenome TaxID=256318 RepID=A0A2P2C3Y6_9ZZZZ